MTPRERARRAHGGRPVPVPRLRAPGGYRSPWLIDDLYERLGIGDQWVAPAAARAWFNTWTKAREEFVAEAYAPRSLREELTDQALQHGHATLPDGGVIDWRDPATRIAANYGLRRGTEPSSIDGVLGDVLSHMARHDPADWWPGENRGGSWPPSRPPAGPLRDAQEQREGTPVDRVWLNETHHWQDTGGLFPWSDADEAGDPT